MQLEKIKKPFNLIIFGASGDLAYLKLFPSLYELAIQKRFPEEFSIVGFARSKMTNDEFRHRFKTSIKTHIDPLIYNEKTLDELLKHVYYHQGNYDQPSDYDSLAEKLLKAHENEKVCNLAFFAIPPVVTHAVVEGLGNIKEKLGGKLELMLEKPFGQDRKSAGDLFEFIERYFENEEIFLIDHYLGKAAVRSIFPLRYNNAILNLLLKGEVISNIQISALETEGVEERIGFFENVGIIKDMIQSHLLQILALLTMNMPVHQEMHSIRREKGDILSSLRLSHEENVVLGQYESYKNQKGVLKDSNTPTFAALRFFIDLTDWYQVPIYIRAGKKLAHKYTYIVVEFRKPTYAKESPFEANKLIIELYPKEKMQLKLVNDIGKEVHQYSELLTEESLACMGDDCLAPYANLFLDAFLERYTSFLSMDEILASWHFIDAIEKKIKAEKIKLITYGNDSEGPMEQHLLTKMDHNHWYDANHLSIQK